MGDPTTRVYRKGVLEAEGFPVADVSEYLGDPETVVWVDFCGPSKEQLHELADELGLHELAVEDALGPHQRPKLDHYDDPPVPVLPRRARRRRRAVSSTRPRSTRSSTSAGSITVRKDEGFSIEPVLDAGTVRPTSPTYGVSFLLYGLLDVIVDGYFDDRPGLRRLLRRGERGDLRGTSARSGPAAPLVRDAAGARPLPPARRARCARP